MKKLRCRWIGVRPLLMHNGRLADQLDGVVKQIKEISAKKNKMTETDRERVANLEWEGSLYWNEDIGLFIPNENVERCIQLGAQKRRLGKDVQSAIFVEEAIIPLKFKGNGKDISILREDETYRLSKGVRVKGSRIIRVRPKIELPWSIDFSLGYDDTIINESQLKQCMDDAGSLVGLGDWRPKFGRFVVEFPGGKK